MNTQEEQEFRDETAGQRVTIVAPAIAGSFVTQDARCLRNAFTVTLVPWRGLRAVFRILRESARSRVVMIWFVGRHAPMALVAAKLFRCKVVSVVGGYEVAWLPEIHYGMPPDSLRRTIVRWVLRHSDCVVTVSQITDNQTQELSEGRLRRRELIPNAVDVERFSMPSTARRRNVITVATLVESTIRVKGIDLFRDAAALLPDVPFVLVGPCGDDFARRFVEQCPPNLTWVGAQYDDDLRAHLAEAAVYFQGSMHESFSVSTAEAMATGCIPVVARRGALPEVVGETGVIFDERTPETAARAIQDGLACPDERRALARERIVTHFNVRERERKLIALLSELAQTPGSTA